MTSLCWKLEVALVLVLSVIQWSKISSAAVVAKDSDGRLAGPGDDQPAQTDLKPSTNCDSHSVSRSKHATRACGGRRESCGAGVLGSGPPSVDLWHL